MHIGPVTPAQHPSLVDLLMALHAHHKPHAESPPRAQFEDHVHTRLLGADSPLRLVTASGNGIDVVGLAAVELTLSLVDPTPAGNRQCHLKELFVLADGRGQGVGRALMAWVAAYASQHGCCRVDWHVQATNSRGIAFYERLGAQRVEDRLSYRLQETALQTLALKASVGITSPC